MTPRKIYNPPVALRPDDTDREIIAAILATLPAGSRPSDALRAALQAWADMQQIKSVYGMSDALLERAAGR